VGDAPLGPPSIETNVPPGAHSKRPALAAPDFSTRVSVGAATLVAVALAVLGIIQSTDHAVSTGTERVPTLPPTHRNADVEKPVVEKPVAIEPVTAKRKTTSPVVRPTITRAKPSPSPTRVGATPFDTALRSGIELYKKGWYGPAAARFKEAATIDSTSAEAYLWWGRALAKANRPAEAELALQRVLALSPGSPLAEEASVLLKELR
jgi:hypothetical protein